MASLFALGVMSLVWMAFVAGLIAFEKLIPYPRMATYAVTGVLLGLGVLMLVAPDVIPALTVPGSGSTPQMDQMGPEGRSRRLLARQCSNGWRASRAIRKPRFTSSSVPSKARSSCSTETTKS
jgi:Predicted metal-binding integral membrane protein (DUF2182)